MAIAFNPSPGPSLGVEVELELIDTRTGQLASAATEILDELGAGHPDGVHPRAKHELFECCIEVITGVSTTVAEARADLEATIAENITLWNPGIDEASMRTAAERARASRFIDALPDGYDHAITERGGNLSAGQRQLLTIARAMACRSPVVILDEATASVDSLTEKLIDEAMDALFADRTVLVIAHRLSTVAKADRILVLHHGHLVEQGSHEELLARGGRYKLLVETGFAL